jgi:signal transduction histidine kinase
MVLGVAPCGVTRQSFDLDQQEPEERSVDLPLKKCSWDSLGRLHREGQSMAKVAAGERRADPRSSVTAVELQLRQRLAELTHSSRYSVVSELAATIAHEINQPLGAIVTNTETLEALLQSPAPDLTELRKIAADIQSDSQRAADIIRHLRNPLKGSTLELREVDLATPVRDAIQFFLVLAVARNDSASSSIAPMPLPVRGNVVQLHQVILSLIVNAMDAMSDRKVLIATERMDNFAKVSVFDRGPGVPPDKLKKIFDLFFSTKEKMGMGLSIARTIIEAHNGQIWAENVVGGGAVFHIRLPLATFPD